MIHMHLPKSIIVTCIAIVLLLGQMDPAVYAGSPAADTPTASAESFTLDGVQLVVRAPSFPSESFTLPASGAADQIASSIAWQPFRELSITAIPFGRKPGNESLPVSASGGQHSYEAALRAYRSQQTGKVQDGPTAVLFGRSVTAIHSVVSLYIDGPVPKQVVIDEWVVEAGPRLWLVRASQEQTRMEARSADFASGLSLDSGTLGNPSTLDNPGNGWLIQTPGTTASAVILPTPPWWNGDCDYNTYFSKSGVGSYRLGAVYQGMPACGPRPFADRGPDVLVRFFSGAWGEYEWECVELTMRFLYLMYGISPYQANGSQVVWNYSGSRLIKVANGSVGLAPKPNDVLSYGATSTFGHASVVTASSVDANGNGSITVIEENNSASGSSTLSVSNWLVSGNAGAISGWLHDASTDTGNLRITINGTPTGTYNVASPGMIPLTYPGLQNGPVHVISTDASSIFASQRVHNANGFINELMGFPTSQLTNDYWFPWYDNLGMISWILVSNPSTTDTAHVTIHIAGTSYGPYAVSPGAVTAKTYPVMDGPVHVTSDFNVFTSERVATGQGFVQETMGVPNNQLTNEYWFPWYDNLGMMSWILVGNPSPTDTTHVTINIAGTDYGPYDIGPGGRITPRFGVMNGPVHVTSNFNVFTSERVHGINGFVQETMGYPANRLTTEYWFPWYDNLGMMSWILVGNPSPTDTATVHIYIGGVEMSGSPFTILPGERITPRFGVMDGPVHITSDFNVFTSERVHTGQGFVQETMGVPANQLTTEYWFPWYDDLTMAEWVLVGKP